MHLPDKSQAVLALFLLGVLLTGTAVIARAALEAYGTLSPTDDGYTDLARPNENPTFGTLDLAFSSGVDPRPTRIAFLKFDLSGVTFPIEQARLNLAVITGCVVPSAVSVAIYGALDFYHNTSTPWTETGITWNNQPDRDPTAAAPLIMMDEGVVKLDGGYHHWTDTGAGKFADWLDTQRTRDGVATLRLEIVPDPGTTEVWFEDSEGTAAGFSTCIASGVPVLQIADADGPLAITLLDMRARTAPSGSVPVWTSLSVLPLLALALYLLRKQVR